MEFLDEMLDLRSTGTNLTPLQKGFESRRLPSPGLRQTPSLSQNPMHLPPLLQSSQEMHPQQLPSQLSTSPSSPSMPNDETKPILIQTQSLEPVQTSSVSTMHLAPLLSQETVPQLMPSQASISPSPPLTPNDETKPILIQTPSLEPVQAPSVSTMHLAPLSCRETQPEPVQPSISSSSTANDETKPILIQTPSLEPVQTPSVSTMHLPPVLKCSQDTGPQPLPVLILTPSLGSGQTPSISTMHLPPLLQSSEETQPQQLLSHTSTSLCPLSTINEETKPIFTQTLSDGTNDEDEAKPISIEMTNDETKPISTEMTNDERKPISVQMTDEDIKPFSIQMTNDEIKTFSIQTTDEDVKPISIEITDEDIKPFSIQMSDEDVKPFSIQMTNDEIMPFTIEMLSDETKPIQMVNESNFDKTPHVTKRKHDCNDDFGQGSTEKILNYLRIKKQKTEWESVEYLFMSYAKSFKQLSLRKQVKIKMALEKLLVETEEVESEHKSLTLCRELDSHEDHFFEYFHMSRDTFEELHYLVRPYIQKMDTNYRKAIGSRERLAVCLRYIRTGNSFITIAYSFRIGRSTVSMIVEAVSRAIWECLLPIYMPTPTEGTWRQSELGYQEIWNFPNCVGSVGGKHVLIQFSRNNGSIVLFAVADPFHNFIVIDVGSYGHLGDSNLFDNSAFYNQHLHKKKLLPPKPLPGTDEPVPHVLIGDEVFPLQTFLMRPFPAAASMHDPRKQTYNHRLGHARSVIENTFSSLTEKWRVFQRPLECNVEKAVHVIKAACCLHNFVRIKHGDMMQTFSNDTTPSQNTKPRSKKLGTNAFTPLRPTNIRSPNAALAVREKFLEYFNRE